ncbi:hypothetical protein B7R54_03155 [Subtercola boreus]|uniref:Glycosyltransferase 2-like domain-containing protein n=1 Tax=Subtercola boreus TaxID=120213 RepID=A0A3E0VFK9_9MICO|nr:glycosyltransferase family 2 protein [Subtercola boreus]RFA08333.1 hypothetical protein B7R54_03155 [Subtercola boreus]TQL54763.1 glycosyl transferase family 2 [Subtercola boreus]
MTRDPSVSVIAPLHNASDYLDHFLRRIAETVREGDQIILIDDGSSDSTGRQITDWAASRPLVTAVVNEKNLGVAGTRNKAVAMAEGDFVWFVDHDDAWEPDILSRLVQASRDADVVICRAEYRTVETKPGRIVDGISTAETLSGDGALELMLTGRVHGYLWTKLIRRELLGVDPFPLLSSQSDFVGVSRMIGRSSIVHTVPDVLYHYLQREGSITRHKEPKLENHRVARDAMIAVLEASDLPDRAALGDYFTAWFYCHAVAFVPVRSHASSGLQREGVRLARAQLKSIDLRPIFARNKRVAAEMAIIRFAPALYPFVISAALFAHDRLRSARLALRSGGSR